MTKLEAQAAISDIINDLMAEHDQVDENYISNLRMFYQLGEDEETDNLKMKLVEGFGQYYCQTMFSENPVDVLTKHHLELTVNQKWAANENKDKPLN